MGFSVGDGLNTGILMYLRLRQPSLLNCPVVAPPNLPLEKVDWLRKTQIILGQLLVFLLIWVGAITPCL